MEPLFQNFLQLEEQQQVFLELEKDTQAECQSEMLLFLAEWLENQHPKNKALFKGILEKLASRRGFKKVSNSINASPFVTAYGIKIIHKLKEKV